MANIFSFTRTSNSIEPMGVIELSFSQWSSIDIPVDICLYETDIRAFEAVVRSGSRRARTGETAGTHLGRIACTRITGTRTRLYCETPTQVADATDAVRPIPFRVRVPSGSETSDTREFVFRVRGPEEPRFEILVQIINHETEEVLAPLPATPMVANLRGIVMPRFVQIVQPYFRADWQPSETSEGSADGDMVDACVSHIRAGIDNASWQVPNIMAEALYRNAGGGSEEPWVRNVVEHLTGSPYKRSQLAYGGAATGWRDHLRDTGHHPVCNVCDQLSSVIQWCRGVAIDYISAGITVHMSGYRRAGTAFYETYDEAMSHVTEWAKSGATIFLDSVPSSRTSSRADSAQEVPAGTDDRSRSPQHEFTILRAKGSGDSLRVQLFDYGGNLSGPGPARGFVGTLLNVAQESGWQPPADALRMLGQDRFMGVGWRPYRADETRRLHDPVGNVTLVLSQMSDGSELRRLSQTDLHGGSTSSGSGPQTILPVAQYMCALSGMPHADQIKATFKIESISAFTPAASVMSLVDIETDATGSIQLVSRVPRD
jgi:hypothetical protein